MNLAFVRSNYIGLMRARARARHVFAGVGMPFIRLDEDGFEEADEGDFKFTGDFNYYAADQYAYEPWKFDPGSLTGPLAAAYRMLQAIGLSHFRVRYDGGHDEGFSHADGGRSVDGSERSLEQVVSKLTNSEFVNAIRAAFPGSSTETRHHAMVDYYATLGPAELVKQVLDDLGDEMASCFLGDGYGTGEYSIYGEFTADLATGTLTDNPSAEKKPGVMFD